MPNNEVEEEFREFLFLTGTKLALSFKAVVNLCNYLRATFDGKDSIDEGYCPFASSHIPRRVGECQYLHKSVGHLQR
jgi:hypothetical protein